MAIINARRKQFLLPGSLAVAATAFAVTACGGGNAAAIAQGSAPGHWTAAEVGQFTAAAGAGGSSSQASCAIGYFERDMSFGNAMAVVSVDPASGPSMSAAQVKTALIGKYGATQGDSINATFEQTITDANNNCDGSDTSSTTPTAAPAPTAEPVATSESSCTVDCVNPIPSGESGWLAQVQGALQNVQQDLSDVSSDASSNPNNLATDGSQLAADAQAALDPNYDPPPADNADWVSAMNDYVTAGEDYSGDNTNTADNNNAAAGQEISAGNSALASFNAANGDVLSGIIESAASPTPTASAASTPTASAASPLGTWNVTYGAPAVVSITQLGSQYTIAATTPVNVEGSKCYLPAGTDLATFSGTGSGTYSGRHGLWSTTNCSFASWTPTTFTLSGNTLTARFSSGSASPVIFTRAAGGTPGATNG
jgi:hypothetical protein